MGSCRYLSRDMQRDIGISPFQSKLQTHVVDIVYLTEMIYLEHMKESINLKYVSVNSSKSRGNIMRHCISTKDHDSSCPQSKSRCNICCGFPSKFRSCREIGQLFSTFLEICCILSWVQFLSFQWFPGRPEFS